VDGVRVLVLPLVVAGIAGGSRHTPPQLLAAHPCPDAPGFTCSRLAVPLDHGGAFQGRLVLQVATQNVDKAPRGVLVFLSGGPGQPAVPAAVRIESRLASAIRGYRLVLFDQRGTGAGALRCPALQREMGSSDLAVPSEAAVTACAGAIGPKRRFFSTADTLADLDALRRALGAAKISLDGVSYGTFVAERYALHYPEHVERLVLDSVVPHAGVDPLEIANAHAVVRVLRSVCRNPICRTDPIRDLAAVVTKWNVGPAVLDALTTMSVVDPSFRGVVTALHAARLGRRRPLDALLQRWGPDPGTPAEALSQGLHASTLCSDTPMPWGGAATPLAVRRHALARAVSKVVPAAVWPFNRSIAGGNGIVRTCLDWPPVGSPRQPPNADLPAVPTLLLSGERDLSTPLAWAKLELARAPRGRLIVVRGAGHSVQLRAVSNAGRIAVAEFLQH
jgi:pimeloyl-ACP methyl ester carboxylesterase